jgi:hypothetical protein
VASFGQTIQTRLNVIIDRRLSSAETRTMVGDFARTTVNNLIRAGRYPATYRRYVDNVEGAPEESVKIDGTGEIVYAFSALVEAVAFTLGYLEGISPYKTGAFMQAWFAAVDGQPWVGNIQDIPLGSVVTIVNSMPYARKLEFEAGRGKSRKLTSFMTESARGAVRRKFPSVLAERKFVAIPGGYVLQRGPSQGTEITYPAVVLSEV